MVELALSSELHQRGDCVFDRNLGINTPALVKIDFLLPIEYLEGCLDPESEVFGAAVGFKRAGGSSTLYERHY